MKRNRAKQLNVSTSQHDLVAKPYGFCCDIKDQEPKLLPLEEVSLPLFPSSGPSGEGPDIKLRIQEDDDAVPSIQRIVQRNGQRVGQRSGHRGGPRSKYRGGKQINWDDEPRGRRRKQRTHRGAASIIDEHLDDRMICKRCRGPLQWYLEDEIAAAREIMMNRRQEKYNEEMERNIKIAKKKEKRRLQKRKKILSKQEEDALNEDAVKEDTQEDELKYAT